MVKVAQMADPFAHFGDHGSWLSWR